MATKLIRDNYDITPWLGPAVDDLTDEQFLRVVDEANSIDERYPDEDDEDLRAEALSAAVQYLLDETTLPHAAEALRDARRREAEASAAAQTLAVMAVADGMSEVRAAEAAGIDRMTLRKAQGKR